jgi:hypothetical protein
MNSSRHLYGSIMRMSEIIQTRVGADLSCPPPIFRPLFWRWVFQGDKSVLRQSIVRLREMTDVCAETSLSALSTDIPRAIFTSQCALLAGETQKRSYSCISTKYYVQLKVISLIFPCIQMRKMLAHFSGGLLVFCLTGGSTLYVSPDPQGSCLSFYLTA